MAITLNSSNFQSTGAGDISATHDAAANSISVALITTWAASRYCPIIEQVNTDTFRPRNWQRKYYRQFFDAANGGQYVAQEVWFCYNEVARGSLGAQFRSDDTTTTQQKSIWLGNFLGIFNIDDPFDPNVGAPFLTNGTASAPSVTIETTDPSTVLFSFMLSLQLYTGITRPADATWISRAERNLDWRSCYIFTKDVPAAGTYSATHASNSSAWHMMGFALTEKAPPADALAVTTVSANSTSNGTAYAYFNAPANSLLLACVTTFSNTEYMPIATTGSPNGSLTWQKKYSRQVYLPEYTQYCVQEVWWAYTVPALSGVQLDMQVASGLTTQAKGIAMLAISGVTDTTNPFDDHPNLPGLAFDSASTVPYAPLSTNSGETLAFGFFVNTKSFTGFTAGDGWTQKARFSMDYRNYLLESNNLHAPVAGSRALTYQGPQNGWAAMSFAIKAGAGTALPEPVNIVAAFTDDAGFTFTPTIHRQKNLVAAFADDSGLIINKVDYDFLLKAPFTDDGGFNALPTTKRNVLYFARFMDETEFGCTITTRAPIPYVNISVSFADESTFTVGRPPPQAPDKISTANFTDDSTFRARPTIVPVGGPFFFAWVDEGATFEAAYGVINEDVFAFTIKQSEGDFAKATIVLRNPRVGLLSTGRKRWAFLSIKVDGVLKPLFYGRLIGLPSNIFEELVSIDFIARPFDFVERKAALASTMRTLPYWDGNFIDPDSWDDDDTVLEARTANWHIDRVTHEVTISDLITAEEGTVEFTGTDYFYDGFSITLGTAPLRAVRITATFAWLTYAAGGFDITGRLAAAFGTGAIISSFTYSGLSGDWPEPGAAIGDGWLVSTGSGLTNVAFTAIPEASIPWFYDASTIPAAVPEGSVLYPSTITDGEYYGGVDGAGFNLNYQMTVVPIGYGKPVLGVSYDVERDMGQIVTFTMYTDVQDVLTLAPESDVKDIKITSNSLSDYGFNGEVPIGDNRNRDYIRTVRGDLSLQYLMLVARANLVAATRVVNTTFEAPLMENLDLNLRMGAHVYNARVPGGELVGKITDYTMTLDGTSGAAIISLSTSSSVGRGGAYEAIGGDPAYVDEGYVEAPYQWYRNVVALLPTGDITYTVPEAVSFDDGIDFRNFTVAQAVKQCFVQNPAAAQKTALLAITGADQSAVSSLLATIPTKVNLQLADLSTGPFTGTIELVVADLVIPKQIDLESAI